jgi:hypothetical protein
MEGSDPFLKLLCIISNKISLINGCTGVGLGPGAKEINAC